MYRLLMVIAVVICAGVGVASAQVLPEFDSSTGTLVIPEVKLGNTSVYNARLQFDGNQNFQLLSYDTQAPGAAQNVPPVESVAALQKWLATGLYKNWKCEASAHGPAINSGHGAVRICSNALLSGATATPFPVGAASVKELYSGSNVVGYAVGVKVAAGTSANTWYWYEGIGSAVIGGNVGTGICEGCHVSASTDRVFVIVR